MNVDIEVQRAAMLKTIRTAVRLKYSLLADRELAEVLPQAQAKFDKAVLRGQLPSPLDVKRALGL